MDKGSSTRRVEIETYNRSDEKEYSKHLVKAMTFFFFFCFFFSNARRSLTVLAAYLTH